jgi:hypothetical protein
MRASARDGLDALRASVASARALETVSTLCGRRSQARERSRRFAGAGRKRPSSRDGLDALRVLAACARALKTVLRASTTSAQALLTVLTPCERQTQAREPSRRSGRLAGVSRKRASARDGQDSQDALRESAASARDGQDALRESAVCAPAIKTDLTPCGRRHARKRSRRSRHFAGVSRSRASARDGLDALRV